MPNIIIAGPPGTRDGLERSVPDDLIEVVVVVEVVIVVVMAVVLVVALIDVVVITVVVKSCSPPFLFI